MVAIPNVLAEATRIYYSLGDLVRYLATRLAIITRNKK
jgi:hypothetical protein